MTVNKPILVFQHIACEHPGVFRDFLQQDGIEWRAVELDAGEPVPPLADYAALWVMGGPMDVWQEAEHPWLGGEKQAIREAVEDRNMPFLGLCLGHQLLAEALGGKVGPGQPEIGILPVVRTDAARESAFLQGFPDSLDVLQWHGAEVKRAPSAATVLMQSPLCGVQAMSVGERAFSVQFHVEMTPTTVSEWSEVPAYANALQETLGEHALETFDALTAERMPQFNAAARRIYDNWKAAALTGKA